MYVAWGKRLLDVLVSLLLIVLLSPVLLIAAIAIWVEDRGPALFKQQRVGRDEAIFTILKFRSMPVATPNVESRHATTFKVTRVGAFIRRTSIDELPQLFNVLGGSMSLVGPRPPLPSQRVVALRRASGVSTLKPGVTGLAQISAHDGFTDEQKVALDSEYASSIGLGTDVRIMMGTIGYLFRKPPVY